MHNAILRDHDLRFGTSNVCHAPLDHTAGISPGEIVSRGLVAVANYRGMAQTFDRARQDVDRPE